MKSPMIKSIGVLALLASSSSAYALMPPRPVHKACIAVFSNEAGSLYADDCDQTANNKKLNKEINPDTGCAKDQASFSSVTVKLPTCMPVGMVQL